MPDELSPAANEGVLAFVANGERLALSATGVAEIIRARPLTRVPHSRPSLLGLLNLRGTILPVVSMSAMLGHPDNPASAATRVIVLSKSPPLGLLVDEVADLSDGAGERLVDIDALLARDFAAPTKTPRIKSAAGRWAGMEPPAPIDEEVLLAFVVSGQEYALRLDEVSEVIALPSRLPVLPGGDHAMAGVTGWRGSLLPLVSLRALLGLPVDDFDRVKACVIVVRLGAHWVGLVADSMREILRVPKASTDPVPRVLTRGHGEAKIEAICRLADGERLVSILATAKIFDQATASRILAEAHRGVAPMAQNEIKTDRIEQFVVFQLGDENYGLPIAAVDEVVRRPDKLTRVPRAPTFIEGVMNLRGKVIPVIDQRERFSVGSRDESRDSRVVIVTAAGVQAGFIVDGVSEILGVSADELDATPEIASAETLLFDRVATIERDGRMILLIEPKALLDRVERDLLAAMAGEPTPAP